MSKYFFKRENYRVRVDRSKQVLSVEASDQDYRSRPRARKIRAIQSNRLAADGEAKIPIFSSGSDSFEPTPAHAITEEAGGGATVPYDGLCL